MSELDNQIRHRRDKLEALRRAGVDAYPARVSHDLEPSEVQAIHGTRSAEELDAEELMLRVPGRVRSLRGHGKVVFADVADGEGRLQLMVRLPQLDEATRALVGHLDLGDFVLAGGRLMRTRSGELTLEVHDLRLLVKALRPLPEKWHGLADVETRYRQRYLDLLGNPESHRVFHIRAQVLRSLRRALDARGFLEVETPMLQPQAGGAAARPFVTHHQALDLQVYLRIAPELYLKRLLVGGLHRVYELNRNFRNEGLSTRHNPEFTMLECYWAYADCWGMMDLAEELLSELARKIHGGTRLTFQGEELDWTPPWPRIPMRQAVQEATGLTAAELDDPDALARALEQRDAELPALRTPGHLLFALFEVAVESQLRQPTFIHDYPVEVSPLAKPSVEDPRLAERFELYIAGMECANAFSEGNDPDLQAAAFRQQLAQRAAGDDEAHGFDADYVEALEHGMPPAGGIGIGIDRLVMLLADCGSIRDVILFPLMRPVAADEPGSGP